MPTGYEAEKAIDIQERCFRQMFSTTKVIMFLYMQTQEAWGNYLLIVNAG